MKFPVVLNINVTYEKNGETFSTINRGVFDLYYEYIHRIVNGGKGNSIVEFVDGRFYDFQLTFEEMYEIYSMQNPIYDKFKPIVDAYKKDNLKDLTKED